MFARGVTLLEIMVVILIVGIIAALALPAYRQHLVRVHRSEATMMLYEIAAAQERFYLRHNTYTADLGSPAPPGLGLVVARTANRYSYTVAVANDGQTYIATATPTGDGGQASDGECLAFSIDQRGRRAVSGSRDTSFCWR
jgi:type IV pilus assembly protein PilE